MMKEMQLLCYVSLSLSHVFKSSIMILHLCEKCRLTYKVLIKLPRMIHNGDDSIAETYQTTISLQHLCGFLFILCTWELQHRVEVRFCVTLECQPTVWLSCPFFPLTGGKGTPWKWGIVGVNFLLKIFLTATLC